MATIPTTVDNLPIPLPNPALREREVAAMEKQAAEAGRHNTILQAASGLFSTDLPKERYERMVIACLNGRVAADLAGILKFAEEILDGIDLKYPPAPAPAPTPNNP